MKTYYYIYQITNLVNAKIYVGVHKTKNLDDGYMGSGKVIRSAVMKHGVENFRKDILEFFDTSDAMYAREKEIVTDEFLLREDTYNLRRGGTGGFDYINKEGLNGFCDVEIAKLGRLVTNKILEEKFGTTWQSIIGKRGADTRNEYIKIRRKNDEEFNEKMINGSKLGIERMAIKNSSQMWITDGVTSKKIDKTYSIPEGWKRGRTGNFTNKRYK